MRVLLDTHVLIWALAEPQRLSREMRIILESPENDVLFSAASIWEIAIKTQIHRLRLSVELREIMESAVATGFVELPVHARAAAAVAQLPLHHRDPFDRLLIAQAISEPLRLLTADAALARYSDVVMLAG